MSDDNAVYLCFSVGAINGYAHIGVVKALEIEFARQGKDLHRCLCGASGASAGAMMALAMVLGFRSSELKRFADEQLNLVANELQKPNLVHLYRTGTGMLKPDPIRRVIRAMIERKLGVHDITFDELARLLPGMELWFAAHNTDDLRQELFSAKTTPCLSVVEACTASCMIPVVFEPVEINDTMYVDGGISNSLPFQMFDSRQTIKIYLRKLPPPRYLRKLKPVTFLQHLSRVIEAFETSTRVRLEHDPAPHQQIMIWLPLECISSIIGDIGARDRLFHHGALIAALWAHPEFVNGIQAIVDLPLVFLFQDVVGMCQHLRIIDASFVGEIACASEEQVYQCALQLLNIIIEGWSFCCDIRSHNVFRVVWTREKKLML